MSESDRLTDEALEGLAHLNKSPAISLSGKVGAMARELLVLRRASQAAPAPQKPVAWCASDSTGRVLSVSMSQYPWHPTPLYAQAAPAPADGLRETQAALRCSQGREKSLLAQVRQLKAAPSASPAPSDGLREAVRAALEGELSFGAYDCTRVWDAWSVGTMTQDDFVPVSERFDEIADAVVAALSALPAQEGDARHD